MKLTDLEPQLYRYENRIETRDTTAGPKTGPCLYRVPVASLTEAQCLWFLCPKCFAGQQHRVEVTIAGRGVPDDMGTHNAKGVAVRWNLSGNGFHDLTLTPSILLEGGCNWHGFVTNGDAD